MALNAEQLQTSSTGTDLSESAGLNKSADVPRVNGTEEHEATAAVGEEGSCKPEALDGKPEALDTHAKALEAMVTEKGELHLDCVLFYEKYAKALLESSKLSGSVFALNEQQKGKETKEAPEESCPAPAIAENAVSTSEVVKPEAAATEEVKSEDPTAATIHTSLDVNMEEEKKSEVPCAKTKEAPAPATAENADATSEVVKPDATAAEEVKSEDPTAATKHTALDVDMEEGKSEVPCAKTKEAPEEACLAPAPALATAENADTVSEVVQPEAAAAEEVASEVVQPEAAAAEEVKSEDPTAATKHTALDVDMEHKSEVSCPKAGTEHSPFDEKSKEKTEDKDMVGPRELAWELFETARVILEKQEPKDILRLAGIHQNLGEVAMEDGNFDRAYKELLQAIIMFGKVVTESDERLAGAHQMAGMCSLCNEQTEAAGFHYTAAAESFNSKLTNMLVDKAVIDRPNVDSPEIQFVKKEDLEKLKANLGEEHADYVKAAELNGKINNLIERVIDINYEEEEAAKNPDIHSVVKDIASKLAVKYAEAAEKGAAAVFDTAKDSAPVNELVPTRSGKRPCPVSAAEDGQPPSKKAKCNPVEETDAAAVNVTPAEQTQRES